jgi:uncharacterized membrane protein YeaQ/YmgE (transglycosylase-associated protein family)
MFNEPIVTMLLVGLVVGAIAKLLLPGRDPGGLVVTMALGVAGAFSAGLVGRELGWYGKGQSAGIIVSVVGAIVLLALYRGFLALRPSGSRSS